MFDYQAGDKYKLTLIMVGVAGVLAGMFFMLILMPTDPQPQRRGGGGGGNARIANQRYMSDPDVTGYRAPPGPRAMTPPGMGQTPAAQPQILVVDPLQANNMMSTFLPLAWDLSANSAATAQAQALQFMTPECAHAYRSNIWTDAIAKQVQQSGITSSFNPQVDIGGLQSDGTIVVTVKGTQTLTIPGKGSKERPVKVEYLLKQFNDGLKIAGISEVHT